MDPIGSALTPLDGDSGQVFLAEAAGERSVLRVYARPSPRGAAAHEVDSALLRLVRGLVPVPDVLEVRHAVGDMPALLVTSYVDGERADRLLPRLSEAERARLGRNVGGVLARLAAMPFLRAGVFVDGDLRIDPFVAEDTDLTRWIAGRDLGLAPGEQAGLDEVAEAAQADLDELRRVSLVHGDLAPGNLLVDPGTLDVVALVDWELAHAGTPYADLGSVLRAVDDPGFAGAALSSYAEGLGEDPALARSRASAADLFPLVELAGRRAVDPRGAAAHDRLRRIGRKRDRGA